MTTKTCRQMTMKKMKVLVLVGVVCVVHLLPSASMDEQCATEILFDNIEKKFKCLPCGNDSEQTKLQTWDNVERMCRCNANAKTLSRVDEYTVTCQQCNQSQTVTSDGWDCTEKNDSCKSEMYDVKVDRDINGKVVSVKCEICENGTWPDAKNHSCIPCSTYDDKRFCPPNCPTNQKYLDGGGCVLKEYVDNLSSHNKIKYPSGEEIESDYLNKNLATVLHKCRERGSRRACNSLLNMCALKHYESCEKMKEDSMKWFLPFYAEEKDFSTKDVLPTEHSFKREHKNSRLRLKVARYSVDGRFLGVNNVGAQMLKVCGGQNQLDETPFMFGVWCSETCFTLPRTLLRSWVTEFYELFVVDGEKNIRVPVLSQHINDDKKKKYIYRFFMVENVNAHVVQYASSVKLSIQQVHDGRIYPPVLTIQYKDIKGDELKNDTSFIESKFIIEYWMDYEDKEEDISIAVGVLSVFAILYSGIETWSWSKRSGRIAIDINTLFKLILYVCGNLANTFLLLIYSATLLRLVYYKEQDKAEMMLPTRDQEHPFAMYVIAAFCLKTVDLFHMIVTQVNVDVFFIDWERPMLLSGSGVHPQPHSSLPPVSIWRTYFIANEWNKMQTSRKTCSSFNFVILLLLLKVFSLEDIARIRPSHVEQVTQLCSPFSLSSRLAVAVSLFFAVAFVQMVFRKIFLERYYVDKLIQFTDACSVSNISVFILEHSLFGYYIHGQSVYGNADIDMKGFSEQIKREQENLCSQRGLLPNTTLQTFKIFITRDFQTQCRKIMQPFTRAPESHSRLHFTVSLPSFPYGPGVTLNDQLILCYKTMNKFLSTFIDHALQDLDYVIKDRLPSEKLLNVEFIEPLDKSFFYNDPLFSFSRVLFYGQEFRLLVWEILLICLVDLVAEDFVLAIVLAYVCNKMVQLVRQYCGERNLVRKSLLDGRFVLR